MHSLDRPKPIEVDETEYQFVYELEEVVQDHLERIASMPVQAAPVLTTKDYSIIPEEVFSDGDILDLDVYKPVVPAATVAVSAKQKLADILAARKRKQS